MEDKGILQVIEQKRLKEILSDVSAQLKNIDLVFVSTCYSENFGKLFLENQVKNVIYIQGKAPISDMAAVKFSTIFYGELVKGSTIKDAFDKSKQLIQSDIEKDYFQLNKCCCNHWHKPGKLCLLNDEHIKFYVHKKYHIRCECDFDEYNIHEDNCKLLKIIKEDKAEKYFYFEKNNNNTIKICCMCSKPIDNNKEKMVAHSESFKFILNQLNPDDNNIIFKYKNPGSFQKNSNVYIINDNDIIKNFSIIGRRKQVKEIYNIIDSGDKNINNIHFIIIPGQFEIGKQNFSESVCIYLFERNIINGFFMIEIKESIKELLDKIKEIKYNGINPDGKYIIIIKINYYIENPRDLLNQILNEKDIVFSCFYYIILLTYFDKIDYEIECDKNKYVIMCLEDLKKNSAQNLLKNICDYYGYSFYYNKLRDNLQIDDLLEMTSYSRRKINELAELIGKGFSFEKLKELIKSQEPYNNNENLNNNIRNIMQKEISEIYFLLSIMPSGLPSSMLNLYEPDFKRIIVEEDEENIIYEERNNNWYTIIEKKCKKIICEIISEEKRMNCVCKFLKIYAKLLFYYIQNTRNSICFPDCNVHYQFNSYNGKGIWKAFDSEIYEFYFLKEDNISKEYYSIIEKDFILERHTENIYSLLNTNIDILKNLIYKDNNVEQKEYIFQILLMLPSIHISGKYTKNIISRSLTLCKKLRVENKAYIKELEQKLNLFLLSIKENPTVIDEKQFISLGDQGKIDTLFIKGLKYKDIQAFETSIEIIEKKKNAKLYYLIPYAYYEIGCLYFLVKDYQSSKENLKKGLEKSVEYNDEFIRDKIYIQFASIKDTENYLNKVINESNYIDLIKEAKSKLINYKKKSEPDIFMLNSNPFIKKNNYSILHNSIWAYHNNQYYILQKISKDIKRDIRVKSLVLNKGNLETAFKEKGKMLILQSDDFDEEGNIMVETFIGVGEELPNIKIPEKLNYDVVILCFINSEKLIKNFKGKSKYLIIFNQINLDSISFDMLYLYNKLSVDFVIKFIQKSTCYGIENAFEESYKSFMKSKNKLTSDKKGEINLIDTSGDYITLKKSEENISQSIIFQKKEDSYNIYNENERNGKIIYTYPLLSLTNSDFQTDKYTDDILHLIKLILSTENPRKTIINICSKYDEPLKKEKLNIKTIISYEIMKFLYRHQDFNGNIYYVSNPKKYEKFGITLSKITNGVLGEKRNINSNTKLKNSYVEEISSAFIVINNFEKIRKILKKENINFIDEVPENYQYLILSKESIVGAHIYEITIQKQVEQNKNANNTSKKKSKKNKSKKTSSKNQINNNQNKTPFSSKSLPKSSMSDSLLNKKISSGTKKENTDKKEKTKDLKEKYDKKSDFTIIDHISSSSDSDDSNSKRDSSESENDFDN